MFSCPQKRTLFSSSAKYVRHVPLWGDIPFDGGTELESSRMERGFGKVVGVLLSFTGSDDESKDIAPFLGTNALC